MVAMGEAGCKGPCHGLGGMHDHGTHGRYTGTDLLEQHCNVADLSCYEWHRLPLLVASFCCAEGLCPLPGPCRGGQIGRLVARTCDRRATLQ
jgi:hypothetical protein